MQWLLHGKLAPAVADALRRHEHVPHPLADAGLSDDAAPADVIAAAAAKQWDLLTTDPAIHETIFATNKWFLRSIVYLQLEGADVEQDDAIDRLFQRYKRLTPGRLYTVTGSRVKIRQLPGKH